MAIIIVLLLYSRNIKIQRYYCRSIAKIRRGIVKLFVRERTTENSFKSILYFDEGFKDEMINFKCIS